MSGHLAACGEMAGCPRQGLPCLANGRVPKEGLPGLTGSTA